MSAGRTAAAEATARCDNSLPSAEPRPPAPLGQTLLRMTLRVAAAAAVVVAVHVETRFYGPAGWGVFVTATAVVTVLGMVEDLGIETACAREMAEEPQRRAQLFASTLGLRLTLSIVAAGIAVALAAAGWPHLRAVLLVVAGLTPLLAADAIQSAVTSVFQSSHRLAWAGVTELTAAVLTMAGAVLVVQVGLTLALLAVVTAGAGLLAAAISLLLACRFVPIAVSFDLRRWARVLVIAAPFGLTLAAGTAYAQADTIILSLLRPTNVVGSYGLAAIVAQFGASFASFALAVALPRLATADPMDEIRWTRWLSAFMCWVVLPMLIGGMLLADPIVAVIGGHTFAPAAEPLLLLLVGTVVTLPTGILSTALAGRHRERLLMPVAITVLLVNVAANLFLVPRFGATGAAGALVCSEIVALVLVTVQFSRCGGTPWQLLRPPVRSMNAPVTVIAVWAAMVPSGLASRQPAVELAEVLPVAALALITTWYLAARHDLAYPSTSGDRPILSAGESG